MIPITEFSIKIFFPSKFLKSSFREKKTLHKKNSKNLEPKNMAILNPIQKPHSTSNLSEQGFLYQQTKDKLVQL